MTTKRAKVSMATKTPKAGPKGPAEKSRPGKTKAPKTASKKTKAAPGGAADSHGGRMSSSEKPREARGNGASAPSMASVSPIESHVELPKSAADRLSLLQSYLTLRGELLLDHLKPKVEVGDGQAVLDAIAVVAEYGIVIPTWLAQEFRRRLADVRVARCMSLDDAFGPPHPKGANAESRRWRFYIGPKIGQAIYKILCADQSRPIDKGLFEEVGKKFDMGATSCEEIYRFAIKNKLVPGSSTLKRLAKEWPAKRLEAIERCGRPDYEPEPDLLDDYPFL